MPVTYQSFEPSMQVIAIYTLTKQIINVGINEMTDINNDNAGECIYNFIFPIPLSIWI